MNYWLSLVVSSLMWVPYQNAQVSLAIEYRLDEKSRNPWGDLNITGNYSTQIPLLEKKPVTLAFGLRYENQPGLIGNWGHVRVTFDAAHPDEKIHQSIGIFVNEANTIFDYNPEIISKYKRGSDFYAAETEKELLLIQAKRKFLQEHSLEKIQFLKDKEEFKVLKSLFKSSPHNDTNPNAFIIKETIKKMSEEYKRQEKKYE